MGILTKKQIVEKLKKDELLTNPRKIGNDYDVESSSYDLAVGTIVIKRDDKKLFQKRTEHLEFNSEIK